MTASVSVRRLEDLILTRMLASSKGSGQQAKVRADISRLLPQPMTADAWNRHVAALRSEGLIEPKRFLLTEAGKARVLEALGIEALPPRLNWTTVLARYLMPNILGVSPEDVALREQIGESATLQACAVAWGFDLPMRRYPSLNAVMEAAVCKELGFPECNKLAEVQRVVLSRRLNSSKVLSANELAAQLPAWLTGARRRDVREIRMALVRDWLTNAPTSPPPEPTKECVPAFPVQFDLATFATETLTVASSCPTGWFGERKVFINHVWRALRQLPRWSELELPSFKQLLVEANQARLLELSRADLPELLNLDDVRESETRQVNAVFHFIVAHRNSP
jgi:hypothetical protein